MRGVPVPQSPAGGALYQNYPNPGLNLQAEGGFLEGRLKPGYIAPGRSGQILGTVGDAATWVDAGSGGSSGLNALPTIWMEANKGLTLGAGGSWINQGSVGDTWSLQGTSADITLGTLQGLPTVNFTAPSGSFTGASFNSPNASADYISSGSYTAGIVFQYNDTNESNQLVHSSAMITDIDLQWGVYAYQNSASTTQVGVYGAVNAAGVSGGELSTFSTVFSANAGINTPHYLIAQYFNGVMYTQLDGGNFVNDNLAIGPNLSHLVQIGTNATSNLSRFDGSISEIVVFPYSYSASSLANYFSTKYSLPGPSQTFNSAYFGTNGVAVSGADISLATPVGDAGCVRTWNGASGTDAGWQCVQPAATGYSTIKVNGDASAKEQTVNFIPGSNISISATPSGSQTNLTIGSLGYNKITSSGDAAAAGTTINFVASTGVSITASTTGNITTVTVTNTSSGNSWVVDKDCDLTAEANQTFTTDTTYTFCGQVWTKGNSANEVTHAQILNGTGLQFTPSSSTNIVNGTWTAPYLHLPFNSYVTSLTSTTPVRASIWVSSDNAAANDDETLWGLEVGMPATAGIYNVEGIYGYSGAVHGWALQANQGTFNTIDSFSAPPATNRVGVMTWPSGLASGAQTVMSGTTYSAGWPLATALDLAAGPGYIGNVTSSHLELANATSGTLGMSGLHFFLAAMRNGSATSFVTTIARIRLEHLPPTN